MVKAVSPLSFLIISKTVGEFVLTDCWPLAVKIKSVYVVAVRAVEARDELRVLITPSALMSSLILSSFITSLMDPAEPRLKLDSVEEAEDELDFIHLEIEALNAATNMDVDQAEAILRVEKGSAVSGMKSKEIKRDLLLFAKRKPGLFLNLANDENVELRNFGIKAVEARIINLSQDQRTFHWGSNDRKLFTVPFDENPYSALAAWFKTDEGVEVYKSIEKRL